MDTVPGVLCVLAGATSVALATFDMGVTVLHPSLRGPVSNRVGHVVWRLFRALAVQGRAPLGYAGPVTMAASFAAWVLGLWVGYTLVYLPFLDAFAYSSEVEFGDRSLAEALYISGTALTTVGFGEVVPETDALRLLTVLEAASGLSAITASITYLLSVYSVISELRSAAVSAADLRLEEPEHALAFVRHGGASELAHLQRELVATQQHLRRFPILYYFHPRREEESLMGLLRASLLLVMILRWCVDDRRVSYAPLYGDALERSLRRLLDELEADFVDASQRGRSEPLAPEHARRAERILRERLRAAHPDLVHGEDGSAPAGFGEFAGHAEQTLKRLATAHGYDPEPLLPADWRP